MICKIEYTRINAKRYHKKKKRKKKACLERNVIYYMIRGVGDTFTTSFANPPKMSHVP